MDESDDDGSTSYAVTEGMGIKHPNVTHESTAPRIKAYPLDSIGPYVVFFRPKCKRLNTIQISKDLTKRYSSVITIDMVGTSKLRVTVGDRKQANEIVSCELFTREYHVYLPSELIEISGVITEASLTCDEIKQGCGRFKNPTLPTVEILDCRQLYSVSQEGDKKVYSHSDSFCVTFSGSALPNYVAIDKLRLPVRMYVPKVMHCGNCKQLGHTALYCSNKPRCAACGENHVDGACKTPPKCVYCGDCPPHDLSSCPTYIRQQQHQKRSLQQRSRRSYAEMLKKAAPSVETTNIYSALPVDDQGTDSEVGEGSPFVFKGPSRKRVRLLKPKSRSKLPPDNSPQANMVNLGAPGKGNKRSTPGFNLLEEHDFPALPGTSKTPDAPIFLTTIPENPKSVQQEIPQNAPRLTFSGILDIILNLFNASDVVKATIKGILPCILPFLKQLASKMPLLETFISFDG